MVTQIPIYSTFIYKRISKQVQDTNYFYTNV